MATKVFITIDQGAELDKVVHRVRTTMGDAVDLSMYAGGVCTLKKNYTASSGYSLGVSFGANGEITLTADAANTAAIPSGRYVYDVVAYDPDLNVTRLIEGYAAVMPVVSEIGPTPS